MVWRFDAAWMPSVRTAVDGLPRAEALAWSSVFRDMRTAWRCVYEGSGTRSRLGELMPH